MPAYSWQFSFYNTTFEIHKIVIVSIYLVTRLIVKNLKLMSQVIFLIYSQKATLFISKKNYIPLYPRIFQKLEIVIIDRLLENEEYFLITSYMSITARFKFKLCLMSKELVFSSITFCYSRSTKKSTEKLLKATIADR